MKLQNIQTHKRVITGLVAIVCSSCLFSSPARASEKYSARGTIEFPNPGTWYGNLENLVPRAETCTGVLRRNALYEAKDVLVRDELTVFECELWIRYLPNNEELHVDGIRREPWIHICPDPAGGYRVVQPGQACGAPPIISLLGPSETRPAGTGGISTIMLTAKVTSGGTPKLGVVLGFSTGVTANSGGHDHDDATRPKGTLSGTQGTTDANGEVKVTFTAPQVAGTHTVKATCSACTNSLVSKDIQVKVPDLLPMFSLPFRDARWAYPGIGQVPDRHADNHYLTGAAVTRLLEITQKFNSIWPAAPRLTLNDASLVWGGKFDIPATWERNPRVHNEHRLGDNIDVRANAAPGAVPANIRDAVFRWLRKTSRRQDNIPPEFVIESVNPLWENPGTQNEHFHLRLGN